MGIKPDSWIRKMALEENMISPFVERMAGPGIVSFGLQPAGYDVTLDPDVLLADWTQSCGSILDPLHFEEKLYVKMRADPFCLLPARSFMVGLTREYLRIPRNCAVRGAAKTSYSTIGVNFDVASIAPGWHGKLKLHISNTSNVPVRIYGNMGIGFLEFSEVDGEVEKDYSQLKHTRFQGLRP